MDEIQRRHTLKEKKRYLDEKHPIRNFRYVPKNPYIFGQDGKSITIGCSRKPPPPPEPVPGPGTYEIGGNTFHIDIPHTIQKRKETDYTTISSKIGFLQLEPFTRPVTSIHLRKDEDLFYINDSPGPNYFPKQEFSSTAPKIGIKTPYKHYDENIPGPGLYSPSVEFTRPKTASFTLSKAKQRDVWGQQPKTPGPGQYDIIPNLSKPKRWAGKLRVPSKTDFTRMSLQDEIKLKYS